MSHIGQIHPVLVILGRNSDEVGTHLEELTRDFLVNCGYSDVVRDTLGPGADEIDVTALHRLPPPGQPVRIICECKAYRNPVTMEHWLKFLGKLHIRQLDHPTTQGVFIALSGINGAVQGSVDALRTHNRPITVYSESDILRALTHTYTTVSAEGITRLIELFSPQAVDGPHLAYFHRSLFWIFYVGEASYAVFDGRGRPLSPADHAELAAAITFVSRRATGLNPTTEYEHQRRLNNEGKLVVSTVLLGTARSRREILSLPADGIPVGVRETALDELLSKTWLTEAGDRINFNVPNLPVSHRERFLRWLFGHELRVDILGHTAIDALYDDAFIEHVRSIQANVPFDPTTKARLLQILRLSPGATLRLLRPHPMVTVHRQTQPFVAGPHIDDLDRMTLLNEALTALELDFQNRGLSQYFAETRDIRQVGQEGRFEVIDGSGTTLFEHQFYQRHVLERMAPEMGGGWGVVLALPARPDVGAAEPTDAANAANRGGAP